MMDQLRWQARELHRSLGTGCRIWAAGMDKHLPDRAVDVLGQIGAVTLIPGRKKAHSFFVTTAEGAGPSVPPSAGFTDKAFALDFVVSPMVFGAGKMDVGTRLLAERFDHLPDADRIADLGCGTGALGLVAQRMLSSAEVDFIDESYLAVAATEANYRANIGDPANTGARFIAADVLDANPAGLYDLVVCNPPFHQGHVVGDGVAWQMFTSAREQIRIGGQLWIVGNRHLEYHNKLARLFSEVRQLASDPRFVVLAGTRGVMPFVKPPKRKKSKSPRPRPTAG
jgi:16S rRNA (guanine1207-N2)-methyltransferase